MNTERSYLEKRRDPRLEKNVPVKLCCEDSDFVTETRNLSRSGAYCKVNKYIEPMTKLRIQLLLPFRSDSKIVTKKVSCQGVVVRTESIAGDNDGYNVAIYFNDIQNKESEKIANFISSIVEEN